MVVLPEEDRILVSGSLAETLWRLEELRQGFRSGTDVQAVKALDWILSRQGLEGAYRGLFAPTGKDLGGVKLLTGEPICSAALRHILGEEALRTLVTWEHASSPAVKRAKESFIGFLEAGGDHSAKASGFFCCHKCTIAFLRTLTVVKPDGWEATLERGIENIGRKRTADGAWHGFPFYYTLLALSEMDTPSARAELCYASKKAKGLLSRYQKEDRTSRFRRIGLEAAVTA